MRRSGSSRFAYLENSAESTATAAEPPSRLDRVAAWIFWLYLVAAGPILIGIFGTGYWFTWDDWSVIYGRQLNWHGLFTQYNGHWCTLPFLVLLGMFHLLGMNSYRPYQMLSVGSHLITCALLWALIRRTGVRPWIAAVTVGAFVMFGPGAANIQAGFQITFVWPLMFGLGQFLLVDHDGTNIDRRDLAGLLLGFAGLLSSGVSVAVIFAVCVTLLLRRGWRAAAVQGVPLGIAYVIWTLLASPSNARMIGGSMPHQVRVVVNWSVAAMQAAPNAIVGQHHVWGWSLGVLLTVVSVVGIVILFRNYRMQAFRGRRAAAWGLAAGCVLFAATLAIGRGRFPLYAAVWPRYVYVYTLMLLPMLAVVLEVLRTRLTWLMLVIVALIAIGVPANIRAFRPPQAIAKTHDQGQKLAILAFASSPLAVGAPADLVPVNVVTFGPPFGPSIGWLVAERKAGRLPEAAPPPERVAGSIVMRLGLVATPGTPVTTSCILRRGIFRVRVRVKVGDTLSLSFLQPAAETTFEIGLRNNAGDVVASKTVTPAEAMHLIVRAPDLELSIGTTATTSGFRVCRS